MAAAERERVRRLAQESDLLVGADPAVRRGGHPADRAPPLVEVAGDGRDRVVRQRFDQLAALRAARFGYTRVLGAGQRVEGAHRPPTGGLPRELGGPEYPGRLGPHLPTVVGIDRALR